MLFFKDFSILKKIKNQSSPPKKKKKKKKKNIDCSIVWASAQTKIEFLPNAFFHCFPAAPSEEVLTYECFGNNSEGAARDAVKIHVVEDYKYGRHSRRILIFSKIYLHLSYRLLSRPPTEEVATVANVGFFEYDGGESQKNII